MSIVDPRATARARVGELVQSFRRNEADYLGAAYNETQARTDFITPLLAAFGWDVHNATGQSLGLREVIEEATVEVGEERLSKRPDYELRLARQRKIFVEAKKPSVHIDRNRDAAFQTRRYGYSASLPIAVLTNFHQLAIYDCLPKPDEADEAHVARILLVRYDEFEARFDELWPLLSREAVYSGDFDRRFSVDATRHGADQFDDFFLRQVRSWRERLARDIHQNTPGLSPAELTYAVQLFLSRIVFLRICEDRDIERYENLRGLSGGNSFNALLEELRRADAFYDSGLFRLLDDARLGVRISDDVLSGIINELYYPQSPYTFAVVETEVLGEIYEQFLGEIITINAHRAVEIVSKPEVRESGGVVPTPRYIVDAIVQRTLGPHVAGRAPADLATFTVADICCGSGIFLLSVFEFLTDHYLAWYQANDRENHVGRTIYEASAGQWRLTFEEKRRILLTHIRGVDIDANAVEVARFSLLLKLIEDESAAGLQDYVDRTGLRALPELEGTLRAGNSLVSQAEWMAARGTALPARLLEKVNPFAWPNEFPAEHARGGFDVIVGNPPYIRIQNMQAYSPEEAAFYQNAASPYTTAQQDNFDKYALFIERSLSLVRPDGRLGFIIPHKFMTIQAGRALRRLVTVGHVLEEIVHFGVQQVFGRQAANYTCLLILDRRGRPEVAVERVEALEPWRYGAPSPRNVLPAVELTDEPWQFANADTRALFARIRAACNRELRDAAEIFVGVQTSADPIYIFRAVAETTNTVTLRWNDRDWPIERDIVRPCLHDARLYPYTRAEANAWMIFPYEIVNGGRTAARLIQPAEMAQRFPVCLEYLTARQAELERRNIVGGSAADRQFYQFGRSQSLTKFDSPKIILPILSLEARYAYDENNIMMTGGGNGPYYLIRPEDGAPETNFFLLAVLHHPLSEAMIRTHTSPFRGGYYSHGKQFIEHLPIPLATPQQRAEIDALVGQLIGANDAAQAARTPHQKTLHERNATTLRDQIEVHVSSLFGLSGPDIALAKAVPIPA
ncbi:MAG: Eco57I restriction-modification methylase domain-containing protein [Proteobacteria bacterium]|nr:Eco57I restriction-modification methylase domain-containing protein [Pseudomonadota bacterium]